MNNVSVHDLPHVTVPVQTVYEIFIEPAFRGKGLKPLESRFVGCMRLPFSEIFEEASRTGEPISFVGKEAVVSDYQSFQITGRSNDGGREVGYQVCLRMVGMSKLKFEKFIELLTSLTSQQRESERRVIERGYLK